jgi:hypothetical protein
MNLRNDSRILAVFSAAVVLCLPACERVLDVVDQLEPPGAGSEVPVPNPSEETPTAAPCECASSASLLPLSCGMPAVPLYDNDVVQLTADGGVVVFNVCDEAGFNCSVLHWEGSTFPISSGYMLGLSASGQRVLSSGDGLGLTVVDVGGGGTILPLGMLIGRGPLSAAGDSVVGTQWVDQANYLARADVASGEIELLGEVGGGVARNYVTPSGSHIIGWGIDVDDSESYYVYRWNEQEGFVTGLLPGVAPGTTLWPEALSADGSVVAGRTFPGNAHFRYTEAGGLVEVASTAGTSDTFLSTDGSVVVGSLLPDGSESGSGDTAVFRWSEASGAVNLTPGVRSLAVDASDDGSVVVASSWEEAQNEGESPRSTFVWDGRNGTRTLDEVLQDRGVDVSGWEFGHARAISGDGKVLVGRATCGGAPTLYRIVLSD